jgi:hypothetical protein
MPTEHTSPVAHALSHAPQLLESTDVSTHFVPHFVVPPAQTRAHAPFTQTSPEGHALSHDPQFAGSTITSTHIEPHCCVPPRHTMPQLPAEQTSPAPQGLLQAPQFAGSLDKSKHELPHCAVPPPQLALQVPSEQTSPAKHATPHAPQLAASTFVLMQVSPQSIWSGPHGESLLLGALSEQPGTNALAPKSAAKKTEMCRRERIFQASFFITRPVWRCACPLRDRARDIIEVAHTRQQNSP